MRSTSLLLSKWKFATVEWSPKISHIHSQLEEHFSHFVLPDLPTVLTAEDRADFLRHVPARQRILTVATCRHTEESLLDMVVNDLGTSSSPFPQVDKLLLVGGNDKSLEGSSSLTTTQAAQILSRELGNGSNNGNLELWGVANPNDTQSISTVEKKLEAGITGFLTQPLLSSQSLEILESYPGRESGATFVAGLAFPKSAKSLQFWARLVSEEEEQQSTTLLEKDPLVQAHVAFFSQPYYTSFAWVRKEQEKLQTRATIDGIHCMPLGNTDDLVTLLKRSTR